MKKEEEKRHLNCHSHLPMRKQNWSEIYMRNKFYELCAFVNCERESEYYGVVWCVGCVSSNPSHKADGTEWK